MKAFSPGRRFAAALVVYLAWVGVLAVMAVTSSTRPPSHPVNEGPVRVAPESPSEGSR